MYHPKHQMLAAAMLVTCVSWCQAGTAKIYWAWNNGSSIGGVERVDLDGSNRELLTPTTSYPAGVDVARAAGKVYYTLAGARDVRSCDLDGGDNRLLIGEASYYTRGIELDVDGGKMYWASGHDSANSVKQILRANLDGSGMEYLYAPADGTNETNNVSLDLTNGNIYWSDFGSRSDTDDGAIAYSSLDGTGTPVVTHVGGDPRGVTVDPAGGKVYWSDYAGGGTGSIYSANLDLSGVTPLISGRTGANAIALDVYAGKLYWSDSASSGSIYRADMADGGNIETLVTGIGNRASDMALMLGSWEPKAQLELAPDGKFAGSAYALDDPEGDGTFDVVDAQWKIERLTPAPGLMSQWFMNKTTGNWDGTPDYHLVASNIDRANGVYPQEIIDGEGLTGNMDRFAVKYSGEIYADQAGTFAFQESVDDYARLYIDGNLLITDNSWNYDRSATISLTAGWHEIEFYTWDGSAGDKGHLNWDPLGGTDWVPVPEDVLRYSLAAEGTWTIGDPSSTDLFNGAVPLGNGMYRLTVEYGGDTATAFLYIPEPTSCLLLCLGIGLLLSRRRKK